MQSHSSTQELEQYIRGLLSIADSSIVQTHLDECEDCQLRLAGIAIQTQWKGPERRTEPRIPVRFHGRLKLLDPVTSIGPPHDVEVIEISRSGMKISTPRFLVPKTLVQVRFNGKTVLAEVRWCIKTESDYHAGLKLVKDFSSM
jgi:hypothetical protein